MEVSTLRVITLYVTLTGILSISSALVHYDLLVSLSVSALTLSPAVLAYIVARRHRLFLLPLLVLVFTWALTMVRLIH